MARIYTGRKRYVPNQDGPIKVVYKNPALQGRTGKYRTRTMYVWAPSRSITIHSLLGAADVLKCTPVRVLQLVHEGKLDAHRLGKEWIVFGPDLEVYRKAQAEKIRRRYRRYLESY